MSKPKNIKKTNDKQTKPNSKNNSKKSFNKKVTKNSNNKKNIIQKKDKKVVKKTPIKEKNKQTKKKTSEKIISKPIDKKSKSLSKIVKKKTKDTNSKKNKKSPFASLKQDISKNIDEKKTKSPFGSLKEDISKDITKKKSKSPFGSLKESLSKDLEKEKPKKFDMAFLKATIKDTLREKDQDEGEIKILENRVATGIEGFDETIEGGFVKDSVTLLCGGPGSGKSIFAMQYLINGIDKCGENGVYISFEEEPKTLIEDMKRFDFDIEKKIKEKKIALLYFSPEQVDRVIAIGGGPVREVIESINAKRAVIDSVTAFTLLYKTSNEQRKALMSLFKTLKKWDCTTLLVSEQTLNPEEHVSTVEEYQSEGVIFMYNIKKGDVRERSIEVFKMRGTNHSTKINPLKITFEGIIVYPEHNVY